MTLKISYSIFWTYSSLHPSHPINSLSAIPSRPSLNPPPPLLTIQSSLCCLASLGQGVGRGGLLWHVKPTRVHAVNENWLSLSGSSATGGNPCPSSTSPHAGICLPWACTSPVFAVTVTMSSCVQLSCCVWRTPFHWCEPPPLALPVFLTPLLEIPESCGECDIYVPIQ